MNEIEKLEQELKEVIKERNLLHAQLTDSRLSTLEGKVTDHEVRIRNNEENRIQSKTLMAMVFGGGVASLINLLILARSLLP